MNRQFKVKNEQVNLRIAVLVFLMRGVLALNFNRRTALSSSTNVSAKHVIPAIANPLLAATVLTFRKIVQFILLQIALVKLCVCQN